MGQVEAAPEQRAIWPGSEELLRSLGLNFDLDAAAGQRGSQALGAAPAQPVWGGQVGHLKGRAVEDVGDSQCGTRRGRVAVQIAPAGLIEQAHALSGIVRQRLQIGGVERVPGREEAGRNLAVPVEELVDDQLAVHAQRKSLAHANV